MHVFDVVDTAAMRSLAENQGGSCERQAKKTIEGAGNAIIEHTHLGDLIVEKKLFGVSSPR